MTTSQIIRLTFIIALWLVLCWLVVAYQPFTPIVAFTVVASGIVIFVPLYKKYRKTKK